MEPAAVLVRAFEVEVGREIASRRACEPRMHGVVRGARVEPHVQRVAALLVVRTSAPRSSSAVTSARPRCRPSRRASPLPPAARACADAARRSRGAGRTASARPTGAGATASSPGRLAIMPCRRAWPQDGKNSVFSMPRSAVARKDSPFDGLVHRREPLRGGAQDHRRLVAPAVHVAVGVLPVDREQRALLLDRLDDLRIRLPDRQAAEQRQRRRELAVAHHRREDLVVLHAVAPAGLEVLDAVGRRRVHDAGAGIERDVLAEVDRRRRGRRTDAGSGCSPAPRPCSSPESFPDSP